MSRARLTDDSQLAVESEHDDVFVTDLPRRVVGSRAQRRKDPMAESNPQPGLGLSVVYEGPFRGTSGYAKMNRNYASILSRLGVKVRVLSNENVGDEDLAFSEDVEALEYTSVPQDAARITGATVPMTHGGNGRRILYTMMESSQGVHKEYAERLNMVDEVWVPTNYLKDMLAHSGVAAPIEVFPLGVDLNLYNPDARPIAFKDGLRRFKFLSVFAWSWRKGYDLLLKSFLLEFSKEDDVCLVISTKPRIRAFDGILKDIAGVGDELQKPKSIRPQVVVHVNSLPEEKMPSLYRAADAFVMLSRGEGMGLPYLEAGACGLPVIATNCTAQSTFLDDNVAYMVEPEGYAVADINQPALRGMASISRFFEGQMFPVYGDDAIDQARAAMRRVFEHRDEALAKANVLRKRIEKKYTWDRTARLMVSRLRRE